MDGLRILAVLSLPMPVSLAVAADPRRRCAVLHPCLDSLGWFVPMAAGRGALTVDDPLCDRLGARLEIRSSSSL